MSLHPLDGAFERLRRGEEHLTDLRQRLADVLRQQEESIAPYFDPDPPHRIKLTLPTRTFVTMRVGILIGEICYNLRSALDYLVFELAKLDSGAPQDGTQFPIEDSPKGFSHRVKTSRLKGINAAHVAAIEGLQPYNGCHWTKALRDLSNPDKHREFPNIGGDVTAHAFSPTEDRNFVDIQAPIRRATHPVLGEMDVKVHFTGRIQFADGAPIIETLELIKVKVADTLTAFKGEFT